MSPGSGTRSRSPNAPHRTCSSATAGSDRAPTRHSSSTSGSPCARPPRAAATPTEAIGELLRYLFEDRGKHKVCADCDTRNDPSWRLLERLGFTREGTLRGGYRDGDEWSDEHLYGLLAGDWRQRRDDAAAAVG